MAVKIEAPYFTNDFVKTGTNKNEQNESVYIRNRI